MDGNNLQKIQPEYQTLGKKVFWLFFLQIAPAAFILLIISIALFILSLQPFLTADSFGSLQEYITIGSLVTFLISLIFFVISFAIARLIYINYVFLMADDSFKIKRGFFSKTENAIPYRQIQNVDIERNFIFQMLGLSRLVILTAGHEDENPKQGDEAEGIIPAIDQKLAETLQTELLRRAKQN